MHRARERHRPCRMRPVRRAGERLMALRRSAMNLGNMVSAPTVQRPTGPVCLTCGRTVDKEEIVEGYPGESTYCKVLVKHHGAEELRTFDMGSTNWDHHDLGQMMRRANWFDPNSFDAAAFGVKGSNANDDVEPDAAPRLVVPGQH